MQNMRKTEHIAQNLQLMYNSANQMEYHAIHNVNIQK